MTSTAVSFSFFDVTGFSYSNDPTISEALELEDKDDSLWYNLGSLYYENALVELEMGNKQVASGHLDNACNKLEQVLYSLPLHLCSGWVWP